MPKAKLRKLDDGTMVHESAGALIERDDGTIFLIDRGMPPYGHAGPAGHVDEGKTPEHAVVREVAEEIGFTVERIELIKEELVPWNECSKGVKGHCWYLFRAKVTGEPQLNKQETKGGGWYPRHQLGSLKLEPVWQHWFKTLGNL